MGDLDFVGHIAAVLDDKDVGAAFLQGLHIFNGCLNDGVDAAGIVGRAGRAVNVPCRSGNIY